MSCCLNHLLLSGGHSSLRAWLLARIIVWSLLHHHLMMMLLLVLHFHILITKRVWRPRRHIVMLAFDLKTWLCKHANFLMLSFLTVALWIWVGIQRWADIVVVVVLVLMVLLQSDWHWRSVVVCLRWLALAMLLLLISYVLHGECWSGRHGWEAIYGNDLILLLLEEVWVVRKSLIIAWDLVLT